MTDPIIECAPNAAVGSTVLGFVLQALSWLAFGFFFGAGLCLAQAAMRRIVS